MDPTGQILCPGCQHRKHAPGDECEAGVQHGLHRWHRCLCLNQIGASRACPPQMDCQGGTLGYADIWHLRQGRSLCGMNGETITPDGLTEAVSYPQPDKIRAWLDGLLPAASPFVLRRNEDVTGVSGTGVVADGVTFPAAGKSVCVVRWRGERGSTVVWDHVGHVKDIHGHDGRTVIELVPVGELIAALKEVADIGGLSTYSGAEERTRGYCEGWNEALAEVHSTITGAIEALHDHGEVAE